jgi:acetyltransferase
MSAERTADGEPYRIRGICDDDTERERAFLRGLSTASRYSRLMYSVREPSAAFINQLVTIDFRHTMAFVAVTGEGDAERIIGVARYADSGDGSGCEFAVAVTDDWQSRGVGTAMTRRLFAFARAQGLLRMTASILATNSRMIGFAHRLGFTTCVTPDDATLLQARLTLPPSPQAHTQ